MASYKESGVDVEEGYRAVDKYKEHAKRTAIPGLLTGLGSFNGMFEIPKGLKNPVMVSGTDGVGTKLDVAFQLKKYDTVGIDCVAMSVNDILCSGVQTLFFLDYVACGKLEADVASDLVKGVADGCVMTGCALLGGETAEMPGMYQDGEYDIAGFTVGAVEKADLIDGSKVAVGDVLVGIASSGVHSNGFSLVRKIIKDNKLDLHKPIPEYSELPLGEYLLTPTRIYVKQVLEVIKKTEVHGVAHITGGGFDENIPRILKEGMGIHVVEGTWPILPVFKFLEKYGNVPHREMFNIYNMGIGMVLAMPKEEAPFAIEVLSKFGDKAYVIGEITDKPGVDIELVK